MPPKVTLTVPLSMMATAVVLSVKLRGRAPAAIVSDNGGAAEAQVSEMDTTVPPVGAGARSVTTPLTLLQPVTRARLSVKLRAPVRRAERGKALG